MDAGREGNENRVELEGSRRRLRQFVAYGRKVYSLAHHLALVRDRRRKPITSARDVAAAVLFTGLLRIRSLNALEPKLSEKPFLRLLDSSKHSSLCSVDTISRALRAMDLRSVRRVSVSIVEKAERNKVFREGWYGAMRYVAIDGWEPICSYERHCGDCLVRQVKVKQRGGEIIERPQYYHRYAVAMLIDRRFDLALDIEPLLPQEQRQVVVADTDEGELTAAARLLERVKQTYGWLDVVVADALYANGPFLTLVRKLGMGAVIIARKETDEPLKEALYLWGDRPAEKLIEDSEAQEHIELWDCHELQTLNTYDGTIRVVKARVTDETQPDKLPKTWCMLVTGKATKLVDFKVLAVARSRWHIENTAFHQWTTHWHFNHVFVHHAKGILALYWLFFAAFNLLTLFLYRQLRCYGRERGKDVTRTISRLIDEMQDDLARLDCSPWDTS
jgi:NAD(P)-dependent dehydrogenase (short-subunit alcohol dehydrogenase family)